MKDFIIEATVRFRVTAATEAEARTTALAKVLKGAPGEVNLKKVSEV